ncbi:MAG: alpha/beta hydrolase, partial [Dehalococcoidia bacterium]|nr:alpha/beta hydrolase [Dehalococcoidia bacterium]
MPKAKLNGVETYYEVHGQGLPVLLIHGGAGGPSSTLTSAVGGYPAEVFTGLFPLDRVQLTLYDRRSAGRSQYVLAPYTLFDLVRDAHSLTDLLGAKRSVVIGDSMGGPISILYALTYPQDTIALALVETSAALMSGTARPRGGSNLASQVERARELGDRAFFEWRKDELRHPPDPPVLSMRENERVRFRRTYWRGYLEALSRISDEDLYIYSTGSLRNMEAAYGVDLRPRLAELRMPVLVVQGSQDEAVNPVSAEELRNGIPHAEVHVIEGGTQIIFAYSPFASSSCSCVPSSTISEESITRIRSANLAEPSRCEIIKVVLS